jgi:hypothetical protein
MSWPRRRPTRRRIVADEPNLLDALARGVVQHPVFVSLAG